MSVSAANSPANQGGIDHVAVGARVFVVAVLGLALYGAISTDEFLTLNNLRGVLSQSAYIGVFAIATGVIMISGNLFSLSIGVTGAVTATSVLALLPNPGALAIGLTLLLGIVIFAVQGLLIGFIGANPIIVSIAAGGLQEGLFLWATNGETTVPPPGDTTLSWITSLIDVPVIGQLPTTVFVMFGLVIILDTFLRNTRFGTSLYLVGENRVAARAAGLPVGWIITGAFAIAGFCVAIAGVELAAFNGSGSLLVQSTFTYDAIAAAVVGGLIVTGGRGWLWQAVAGAIFIQAVSTILLLRGYPQGWQILAKGVIVFGAVVLIHLNRTRGSK